MTSLWYFFWRTVYTIFKSSRNVHSVNALRPRKDDRHFFADEFFICISWNENFWIWMEFHWNMFLGFYIFILDVTPAFNGLGRGTARREREIFKCWDLVRLTLEVWQYKISFHIASLGFAHWWMIVWLSPDCYSFNVTVDSNSIRHQFNHLFEMLTFGIADWTGRVIPSGNSYWR